jgi:flagellar hook-associated protein 2
VASTFQFGGLVSGLDTSKMIETLMAVERRPLDQLEERQQALTDRKTALGELSGKLATVRSKALSLLLSSTTQARTATSSDTGVATASAGANTAVQSVGLNVTSLATKTIVTSANTIGSPVNAAAPLASAGLATTPTTGKFSINGTSIAVDAATDSLSTVINRINTTFGGTVTAALDGTSNRLVLSSTAGPVTLGTGGDTSNFLAATKVAAAPAVFNGGSGAWETTSTGPIGVTQTSAKLADSRLAGLTAGSGSFTINGVSFSWNGATDTLNGLIGRINGSAANVVASYDASADKFTLKNRNTGGVDVAYADTSGDLMGALFNGGASKTLGQNAQYSIDGGPAQYSTSNVVTDALTGVSITLKGTGATTLDVAHDTSTAVTAVKDFVSAFNEALTLVRDKTKVDVSTSTRGIFAGDSFIQGIEYKLRGIANSSASGLSTQYKTLPSIGISTGAIGAAVGSTNELVLDEAKLTKALQTDPTAVTALLSAKDGPVDTLNKYLLGITSVSGPLGSSQQSADRQIYDLGSQMRTVQDRLDAKQAALEKKFADLESTMSGLQAQGQQLSAQIGQLGAMGG